MRFRLVPVIAFEDDLLRELKAVKPTERVVAIVPRWTGDPGSTNQVFIVIERVYDPRSRPARVPFPHDCDEACGIVAGG